MMGERVVAAARAFLGTPYRHQAATAGAGCDCLGLLRGVWRALYGDEPGPVPPYRADRRDPDTAGALADAAARFLQRTEAPLAAGQVVLFRIGSDAGPRHCAVLVSPTRFIHAQEHLGVVEANLTEGWAQRIWGRFTFPDRAGWPD